MTLDALVTLCSTCRLLGCLVIVLSIGLDARAQARVPTEAAVRQMTREASTSTRGDTTALVLDLDRRVRQRWGDFESFPISLLRREDLTITLTMPYMGYRRTLANYLKIGRPSTDVPWTDAAVVEVAPSRIGAPDVREVVVTRAGQAIAAIGGGLKPTTFADGSGAQGVLSAGAVRFPTSTFAPGAEVIVTARLASGELFTYELSAEELEALK